MSDDFRPLAPAPAPLTPATPGGSEAPEPQSSSPRRAEGKSGTGELDGVPGDAAGESKSKKGYKPRRTRSSRAASAAATRTTIRRTAERAQLISDSEPSTVALLAAVLRCENTLSAITYASMTASQPEVAAGALSVIDAEPSEAGVVAATLDGNLRPVWAVFHHLGIVGEHAPESDVKAAIAVASAVHASDTTRLRSDLTAVLGLLESS